jgi:3-deoxy-D-manno-octulosonic-acid transferase
MAHSLQLQLYQVFGKLVNPFLPFSWTTDEGLRQRLGYASAGRPQGMLIWIHAVSLGELVVMQSSGS